jgi:hypothetical protein
LGPEQVAQAARWLATLKASGCLCLLDGGEIPEHQQALTVFCFLTGKIEQQKLRESAWKIWWKGENWNVRQKVLKSECKNKQKPFA